MGSNIVESVQAFPQSQYITFSISADETLSAGPHRIYLYLDFRRGRR